MTKTAASVAKLQDLGGRSAPLLGRGQLRLEIEHALRVATQDISFVLFGQERQVVDGAWQVHIPVRIVGRVQKLRPRIDHLEGDLQCLAIVHHLHGLRGKVHLAHVFARLPLEQWSVRRPHHEFIVQPLHQEGQPRQSAFDPYGLQLRKPLRHAIHEPVRHVEHVAPGEAQAVHGDEPVGEGQALFAPIERRVEAERHSSLLQRRIDLHVRILEIGFVCGRCDHEPDDAFAIAEFVDHSKAHLGIVEGKIEHRLQPRIFIQDLVAKPPVVGQCDAADLFPSRAAREIEHRGRKHDRRVDSHGIHPSFHQGDVTVRCRRHPLFAAHRIAGDAPAVALIQCIVGDDASKRHSLHPGLVAQDRILDELGDLLEGLLFVVMGIRVNDEEVVVVAILRLLRGIAQESSGIELFVCQIAKVVDVGCHSFPRAQCRIRIR